MSDDDTFVEWVKVFSNRAADEAQALGALREATAATDVAREDLLNRAESLEKEIKHLRLRVSSFVASGTQAVNAMRRAHSELPEGNRGYLVDALTFLEEQLTPKPEAADES